MRGRNDDLANCDCGANDSPRHTAWFTVAFGQAHAVSQRIRRGTQAESAERDRADAAIGPLAPGASGRTAIFPRTPMSPWTMCRTPCSRINVYA